MRFYKKHLSVLIILCFIFNVHAQKREKDIAGWFGLSIKQTIYNKLSYRLMTRVRDGENLTSVQSFYIDAGLFYRIRNGFSVSLNYVFAPSRMPAGYFIPYHQYYTSINNRFRINANWYLSNRIIFQFTSRFFIIDNGAEPYSRTDAREKLTLHRLITRRDKLFIGDEVITNLFTYTTELKRNRLYVGINHRFNKRLSADLFFILQSSFNKKINTNIFVYGFTISYKFKKMLDDD